MKIDVEPELELQTRIAVLWRVVAEFSEAIGVGKGVMECLRKGIFEHKIFAQVEFFLLAQSKECVARFAVQIDWEQHEVRANTKDGVLISIDKNKSVAQQVLSAVDTISSLIHDARNAYGTTELRTIFSYRPEYTEDEEKFAEARRLTGTVLAKESFSVKPKKGDWDFEMQSSSEQLSELGLSISLTLP